MILLDVIIAIPLLWGLYKGFTKGFIVELASLGALFLGIYASVRFCDYLALKLKDSVSVSAEYLPLIAFALIFIGVVAGVFLLAKFIDKIAESAALGTVNRIAGAIFGAFKFAFVLSLLLFVIDSFDKNKVFFTPDLKKRSLLIEPIKSIVPFVLPRIEQGGLVPSIKLPENEKQPEEELNSR
jgi:membrane protein required for colicin V production